MNAPCKSLGIVIARLIVRGDIHAARVLAATRDTWTPIEARAILGAGRYAMKHYGAPYDITRSIMGWY